MSNSQHIRPLSYFVNIYVVIFTAIAALIVVAESLFIK